MLLTWTECATDWHCDCDCDCDATDRRLSLSLSLSERAAAEDVKHQASWTQSGTVAAEKREDVKLTIAAKSVAELEVVLCCLNGSIGGGTAHSRDG